MLHIGSCAYKLDRLANICFCLLYFAYWMLKVHCFIVLMLSLSTLCGEKAVVLVSASKKQRLLERISKQIVRAVWFSIVLNATLFNVRRNLASTVVFSISTCPIFRKSRCMLMMCRSYKNHLQRIVMLNTKFYLSFLI